MKVIPREVRRITYSSEIRELKKQPMTDFQKAVVVGSVLGDGCLCSNWSNTNSRLKMSHSIKQAEYVSWKYDVLKSYILTPPKIYKPTMSVNVRTISHPDLTELSKIFYVDGTKIIPECIETLIQDPITIAVWFMDDGNAVVRNGKCVGYHLNTQSFTEIEQQKLVKCMKRIFDVCVTIEKNKGKNRLAIWQEDSRKKFVNIVTPHIVPSLYYKLG